jgi:hypothetical protein
MRHRQPQLIVPLESQVRDPGGILISLGASIAPVSTRGPCTASATGCTVQATGGVAVTAKIVEPPRKPGVDADPMKGPHVSGGTAYWMTDTELSSNVELKRVTGNKIQLDRDDSLALLTVSCQNDDVTFMLTPAQKSKRANIPFKPAGLWLK